VPSFTYPDYTPVRVEYAEEEDLLSFANRVRAAGGAEPLAALFPSTPLEPDACLIANALNFKSTVTTPFDDEENSANYFTWGMVFPTRFTKSRVQEIAREVLGDDYDEESVRRHPGRKAFVMVLPRLIGNTALAFDHAKRGWVTKYRLKEED
jgi:hypothetical protein